MRFPTQFSKVGLTMEWTYAWRLQLLGQPDVVVAPWLLRFKGSRERTEGCLRTRLAMQKAMEGNRGMRVGLRRTRSGQGYEAAAKSWHSTVLSQLDDGFGVT
jgi:hypothetical protein